MVNEEVRNCGDKRSIESVHGAEAPLPPSEEGGGFLPRRGKKTEGEIHRVCAKAVSTDGH